MLDVNKSWVYQTPDGNLVCLDETQVLLADHPGMSTAWLSCWVSVFLSSTITNIVFGTLPDSVCLPASCPSEPTSCFVLEIFGSRFEGVGQVQLLCGGTAAVNPDPHSTANHDLLQRQHTDSMPLCFGAITLPQASSSNPSVSSVPTAPNNKGMWLQSPSGSQTGSRPCVIIPRAFHFQWRDLSETRVWHWFRVALVAGIKSQWVQTGFRGTAGIRVLWLTLLSSCVDCLSLCLLTYSSVSVN